MKILNSKTHAVLDYVMIAALFVSPTLFGLPPVTNTVTYVLAGVHTLLTVITDFQADFVRSVPFRIHGVVELIVSIALVGIAFYLGNLEGTISRIFYLGVAVAVFFTWLITDYSKRVE